MQLAVSFREVRPDGESRFGMSTDIEDTPGSAIRNAVALGLCAVDQFREEVGTRQREARCVVHGRIDEPSPDWLRDALKSPAGLQPPKVRLYRTPGVSVQLWSVKDVLGFESDDVVSRVAYYAEVTDARLHAHEQSDRLVIVTRGDGLLNVALGNPRQPPQEHRSIRLTTGDVVYLARGAAHGLQVGKTGLEALVLHCPYVPHGDPSYEVQIA